MALGSKTGKYLTHSEVAGLWRENGGGGGGGVCRDLAGPRGEEGPERP